MPPSAQRLHVLQLLLCLDPGGTERMVIELCKRLVGKVDVSVCCLDAPGAWARELLDAGIPVSALHRKPGFHPSLGVRIRRIALARGATVLHCHHYSPYVYGALAALLMPATRLIYTEHGRLSDARTALKRRLANRFFGRLPGAFFAVSENLRVHMIASGFPPARVGVIPNGIDPGPRPTSQERTAARRQLGLPPGVRVFGTVARLDPVKDLGTLIAAFARIPAASENDPLLVIVGDGPERLDLDQLARALNVRPRVRFTGYRAESRRLLAAFDVYVNCSLTEGMSVTVLEAMAAELPVAATGVGGNPELVLDAETGVLAAPRQASALADALTKLAGDKRLRKTLGSAGRERVLQTLSMDRMLDGYLEAYGAGDRKCAT